MNHLITRRRLAAALAVPLAAGALQLGGTSPADAGTKYGTAMVKTQRMTGPALPPKYAQSGWYAKNTRLALSCYSRGQAVTGYYSRYLPNGGKDNLWYKVSDGRWVADVDINTGSNNPVVGACTSSKASRAVSWAKGKVGNNSYYGLCERFVENAYGTSGRYASALAAFRAIRSSGKMRYGSTNIPAGALVFSDGPVDGPYGHVMLSIGGGRFVSGGANGPSVKVFTTPNPGSTFLGWAPAPSSWPGR